MGIILQHVKHSNQENCCSFWFQPGQVSTHSLRIDGASALAAAGVPDYIIQLMGRWKSICFLMYIRLANQAYRKAIDALTDSSLLTVDHMRRMIPGMNTSMMAMSSR